MPAPNNARPPRRPRRPVRPRADAADLFLARHPNVGEAVLIWVIVFAAAVVAMGVAAPGVTWDETFYIYYGDVRMRWLTSLDGRSFSRTEIERHWRVGREHPPLFPLAIGVAHGALGGNLDEVNPVAARGAGIVEYAILAMAVYLFVAGRWGRWAGRLAAVSFVAMPRVFAHGQLAAGDLPMALTWFLSVWAFVRALERPGIGREVLAGVAFGAALLTKMNAIFLPVMLTPWALVVYRRRAIRPLLITYGLGAGLFVVGWPWMWIDTLDHLHEYVRRGTQRARILAYYFGRAQRDIDLPWHYPLVMTVCTVPVGVLVGAAAGAVRGLGRPGRRALVALLVANVAVPLAIFGLPGVPVYDGVRLFLHVFPFVACLAGVGAVAAIRFAATRGLSHRTALGLVLALALVQVVPLVATTPFGLSYYNLLVGGPGGADRLGFETTYWGDGMDQVFWRDLAARVPRGSRIAINFIPADFIRPFYDQQVQRAGFQPVRYEPPDADGAPYDFLIVVCRKGYFDAFVWGLFRDATPVVERRLRFFGSVPLCRVYDVRGQRGTGTAL